MAQNNSTDFCDFVIKPGFTQMDAAPIQPGRTYVGRQIASKACHWFQVVLNPIDYATLIFETYFGPHADIGFWWATGTSRLTEVRPIEIKELEDW